VFHQQVTHIRGRLRWGPVPQGEGETRAVSERRGRLDLVESGVAASDDGLLGGVGVALWTPSPAASSVWVGSFFAAATMPTNSISWFTSGCGSTTPGCPVPAGWPTQSGDSPNGAATAEWPNPLIPNAASPGGASTIRAPVAVRPHAARMAL